jgi:uracil-DNA glycosylase
LRCVGLPLTKHPFAHGAAHQVGELHLVDSFHPSPLNTQTGRLSAEQFLVALDRAIKLTVGGP